MKPFGANGDQLETSTSKAPAKITTMTMIITMPYDISTTEGIFLKVMEMASENMIYAFLHGTRGRVTS